MATINPVPLPVTETDGANTTLGTTTDAAASTDTATATVVAHVKRLQVKTPSLGQSTKSGSVPVTLASDQGAIATTISAGAAKIGVVTTDQTTHGTTDLVAADITKVAGSAISQGHGTAATAIRVELPTDGTGVVGLNAGTQKIGVTTTDQTTHGTTDLVAADITKVGGTSVALGPTTPSASFPTTLPNDLTVAGATATAINTDLVSGGVSGWFDAALYHSVSFNVIAVGTIAGGVVTFEQTNDTTNAAAGFVVQMMPSGTQISTTAANTTYTLVTNTFAQFEGPLMARYFRVRISTGVTGGGTAQVTAVFSQFPYATTRNVVTQGSVANFQMQGMLAANGTVTSGTTFFRSLSVTTSGQNVKSSNGKAFVIILVNTNASVVWVKFYNKNSAPTVGTDTPIWTIGLQANQTLVVDGSSLGAWFSSGIGIGASGAQADADTTSVTANTVTANILVG